MRRVNILTLFVVFCICLVNLKGFVGTTQPSGSSTLSLHNPSLSELQDFLARDTTHTHIYSVNFSCWDFAVLLRDGARQNGLQCGLTYLMFQRTASGTWGHFMDCFEIVNEGLRFVEPQTDELVQNLTVGSSYLCSQILNISIVW